MRLLPILCLLICSCATTVYEGGKPVMRTYSNVTDLNYHSPAGSSLTATQVDNSTVITAGGTAATKVIMGAGIAAAMVGATR